MNFSPENFGLPSGCYKFALTLVVDPIPTLPVNLSGEEPGILAGKYDVFVIRVEANCSQKF